MFDLSCLVQQNCEMVLQYMCEDTADPQVDNFWPYSTLKNCGSTPTNCEAQAFRSGTFIAAPRDGIPLDVNDDATDTIGDTPTDAVPDTVTTRRFGMHESYNFYELCRQTERNMGLYTADQRVRRNDKRGTRQNPNGDRRGNECPEERWVPCSGSSAPPFDLFAAGTTTRGGTRVRGSTSRCSRTTRATRAARRPISWGAPPAATTT